MAKKNYKSLGTSILKDVLDDPAPVPDNTEDAEMHRTGFAQDYSEEARLHVYISNELEGRLLDEVYRRKRNKAFSSTQASKRAVVEDALTAFFTLTRKD